MKLSVLLFSLLLVIPHLHAASDPPSTSSSVATQPSTSDATAKTERSETWFSPMRRAQLERLRQPVCYTMRSYVMARESSDSDVTRRVRYVTCEPSWKFEFRSAVASPSK